MAGKRSRLKGLANVDYCIVRAEKKLHQAHKLIDIWWAEQPDGTYQRQYRVGPANAKYICEILEGVMDEVEFFLDTKASSGREGKPASRAVTQHTIRSYKRQLKEAGLLEDTPPEPHGPGGLFAKDNKYMLRRLEKSRK